MNTEQVNLDTLIQGEVDSDNEFQSEISSLSDEDKTKKIEEKKLVILKARAEKGVKDEELAKNYKTRAEKAESDLKGLKGDTPPKKEDTTSKNEGLSSKDIYALFEAKVPQEDVDEVVKGAKLLGITIPEALKDPLIRGRLNTLAEQRKTAGATNTGKGKGSGKTPDNTVLDNFANDKLPEPGSDEAERLFWLRRGIEKKK